MRVIHGKVHPFYMRLVEGFRNTLIYVLVLTTTFGSAALFSAEVDGPKKADHSYIINLLKHLNGTNDSKVNDFISMRRVNQNKESLNTSLIMTAIGIALFKFGSYLHGLDNDFLAYISQGLGVLIGAANCWIGGELFLSLKNEMTKERAFTKELITQGFEEPANKYAVRPWMLGLIKGKALPEFLIYSPQNLRLARNQAVVRIRIQKKLLEQMNDQSNNEKIKFLEELTALLKGQNFITPDEDKSYWTRKVREKAALKRLENFFIGIESAKQRLTALELDPNLLDLNVSNLALPESKSEITFSSEVVAQVLNLANFNYTEITSLLHWGDYIELNLIDLKWERYPVSFDGRSQIVGLLSVVVVAKITIDDQEQIIKIPISFEEGTLGLRAPGEISLSDLTQSRGFESAFRSAITAIKEKLSPANHLIETTPECREILGEVNKKVIQAEPDSRSPVNTRGQQPESH